MRKRFLIITIVLVFLSTVSLTAFAANSCTDERNRSLSVEWANSYAWDPQYVFMSKGYFLFDDECKYTWGTPHYEISRVDRNTGDCTTLIKDYPYHAIDLILDRENLYILRQYYSSNLDMLNHMKKAGTYEVFPEIEEGETEGTFYLEKMDYDGTLLEKTRFDIGYPVNDQVLYNHKIYLASSNSIICLDLKTTELSELYKAETGIYNQTSTNHMIIEDDILYLQDGYSIVAVDIYTGQSHVVCDFDTSILWLGVFYQQEYLVLDHHLYYWNEACHEMTDLDLETGIRNSISKDRYFFYQATEDGVAAIRIPKPYLDTIYDSIDYTSWIYPQVDSTLPGETEESKEYLFFVFDDSEHPTFDPTSGMQIVIEDFGYSKVYIDQMQYIDEDITIRTLNE